MTDETGQGPEPATEDAAGGSTAVAVAERPGAIERAVDEKAVEVRKDRLWLPFLIPVGAILAVALFTINISRLFLAASENGSTPAVIIGILLTVGVLAGATVVAAIPKLRTSSLVITMCTITAMVMLAGSLVLGASQPHEAASAEPTGPAINTLTVDAFNFHFQAKDFTIPAGINEIAYVSKEGSHTLAFDQPQFSYFLLSQPGGKSAAKIDAVDGQTYTIYCTLPGHRAAGMEATLTVSGAAAGAPEAGTATPSTTLAGGTSQTTAPAGQSETDSSSQSGNSTGN